MTSTGYSSHFKVCVCVTVHSLLTPELQTDTLQLEKKQIFSVSWLALWPTVNRPLLFSWSFRASEWRKEKSPSSIQSSTSSLQGALWHFIECTYSLPFPGGRWGAWYYSRACVLNMGLWSEGYLVLVPVMSENKMQKLTNNNPNHQYHTVTRGFFVLTMQTNLAFELKQISL